MKKPTFITFTGVDERTNLLGMQQLSAQYPVEWGVLYSMKHQGRVPRFPPQHFIDIIERTGFRLAAHYCGAHVRNIMTGGIPWNISKAFWRVQLNHHDGVFNIMQARRFRHAIGQQVICHFNGKNFPKEHGVQWLYDASFGAGIEPTHWPDYPGYMCGYAGGIGPDNVVRIIEKINATGNYWIDMENNVRTNDWLDLNKCRAVCEAVYNGG